MFNFAGCNLETYMMRCRHLTEAHVRSIMQQLLSAVGFLHRCRWDLILTGFRFFLRVLTPHRVVHRDIKPQNILIYCKCSISSIELQDGGICNCAPSDIQVVLADFGLCRVVEPSASSVLSPTLSPQRGRAGNCERGIIFYPAS